MRLAINSDNNSIHACEKAMILHEKDATRIPEAPPVENNPMVRTRLRTLLELAVAIGKREGLLGNNGDFSVEGGKDVTDKRNIRNRKAPPAGKDKAGYQGGK
jgi:hypothetical protein